MSSKVMNESESSEKDVVLAKRSPEGTRASRTTDQMEEKLQGQLKNYAAKNIDVIDPNLDDRYQQEVKLYHTDGSLDLSKVAQRSHQFKKTTTAIVSNVENDAVDDNEAARVARITSFQQLTSNLVPDLNKCTDVKSILSPEDVVLVNLKCKEITNFPGSTMSSHVNGIVTVALVKNAKGQGRIHFAVAEGKYEFKSSESFTQNFTSAAVSCCCCLTFGNSFAASSQSMVYSTHNKFLSQDFVLPVEDCVIDSICYRKGENSVIVASSADALKGASKDSCAACVQSWKTCATCMLGQMACCFQACLNCQRCLTTGNCAYLIPCVEALRVRYWCCSMRCMSDIFWKYVMCYSNDFKSYNKAICFEVSDEFVMGNANEPGKLPVEKPAEKKKEGKKAEEKPWHPCPWFTCWCCYEYQGKDLCPNMGACCKLTFDLCCCRSSAPVVAEKEPEKFKWQIEKEAKDEVIVLVHYRSLLDKQVRTCTIKLDVAQEDFNGAHSEARKFVKLIADYRHTRPLANDYPSVSSAAIKSE